MNSFPQECEGRFQDWPNNPIIPFLLDSCLTLNSLTYCLCNSQTWWYIHTSFERSCETFSPAGPYVKVDTPGSTGTAPTFSIGREPAGYLTDVNFSRNFHQQFITTYYSNYLFFETLLPEDASTNPFCETYYNLTSFPGIRLPASDPVIGLMNYPLRYSGLKFLLHHCIATSLPLLFCHCWIFLSFNSFRSYQACIQNSHSLTEVPYRLVCMYILFIHKRERTTWPLSYPSFTSLTTLHDL